MKELTNLNFTLSWKLTPERGKDGWNNFHSKFIVQLRITDDNKTVGMQFPFYQREADIDPDDVLGIMECILNDAMSYLNYQDIDEFHQELGGNMSIIKTIEVFHACKKMASKWAKVMSVFGLGDDPHQFIEDFLQVIFYEETYKLVVLSNKGNKSGGTIKFKFQEVQK